MNAPQRALVVGLIGLGLCAVFAVCWVLAVRGDGERQVRDQFTPLYRRTLQDALVNWRAAAAQTPAPAPAPAAGEHVHPPSTDSGTYAMTMQRAHAAFKGKQFPQALQLYFAAARKKPTAPLPWARMGDCYLHANQPRRAIAAYRQGTVLSPRFLPAWYGLGIAYRYAGQPDEAIKVFKTVKKLSPNNKFADDQIKAIRRQKNAASQPAG